MKNEYGMNANGNILITTPTLALDPNPFNYQSSLLKVINQIQAREMGLAYLPVYRQLWWAANNLAWDTALSNHFEYILRIDDDIHQIPDDAVGKLLDAGKDVIGAAYPSRRWPYMTNAMNRTKDISLIEIAANNDRCLQYVTEKDPNAEGDIVPCELVGFGMTLIKTEKFKLLPRPIFLGNEDVCPDDTYFAQLCLDHGIKQYVHYGVRVSHAHVDYMNQMYLYNAGVFERINRGEKDVPEPCYEAMPSNMATSLEEVK